MISSSFNLNSSLNFRDIGTSSSGSTNSTSVANIINYNAQISGDTISIQDPSKTLSSVLTNIIKIINNNNEIISEILIDPDNDISIDTSNSDYNQINITLPSSDFDQDFAIFSMY